MSAKDDWMVEMDTMLGAFSSQAILSLKKIGGCFERSGRSFNRDFKEYFFRASNDSLATTYAQFELELLMRDGSGENESTGEIRSGTEVGTDNIASVFSNNSNTNQHIETSTVDSVQIEANCAATVGENDMNKSMNADKSALICIDDSSDEESADIKPKVEKMDGDGELAYMEFQTNSDFDEYLNNPIEENQREQATPNLMGHGSEINNENGSATTEIASDKQESRSTVSVGKGTLSEPGTSSKATTKSAKSPKKRSKAGPSKENRARAGKRSHQCDVCLKTFSWSSDLKRHRVVHVSRQYRFYCVGCARGFDQEDEKMAHDKICEERRYECHICREYATPRKSDLQHHMRIHTGERPFRCNRCSKEFKKSANLQRHQLVHVKRFKYRCVGCARGFKRETDKMAHDKVCDKRRYECHICQEYATPHKSDLKKHMRKHTGEQPFQCKICMEHFTQRGSLKKHLDNIHSKIN